MDNSKTINFDLFNTLITSGPEAQGEAMKRPTESLTDSGFLLEPVSFR